MPDNILRTSIRALVICLIYLALDEVPAVTAQPVDLRFEHLSINDGLSQMSVSSILQDRKGFMWFGTIDGLNRYDGYKFSIYRPDLRDSTSISGASITTIFEDAEGFLWVGTESNGLNRYDPVQNNFTHFRNDPADINSLSSNRVRAVVQDSSGVLWIGTLGGGLNRLDPATGKFNHIRHDEADPQTLSSDDIETLYFDRSGRLWIGTMDDGLDRLDSSGETLDHFRHDPAREGSLSDDRVRVILEDQTGAIWIGTDGGGMNQFDPETGLFTSIHSGPAASALLLSDRVFDIYEDRSGILWIGTVAGLNRFDPSKGTFLRFQNHPADPYSLSMNHVWAIFQDRLGILWTGSATRGINYVLPPSDAIQNYRHLPGNPNSLNTSDVFALLEDRFGKIWIGTLNGLDRLDRATNTFRHFQHDPKDPGSLSEDRILTLLEDTAGDLLIGTFGGGGLSRYDRRTDTFRNIDYEIPGENVVNEDVVLALEEDSSGVLWIGTHTAGLIRFDRATQTARRYRNIPGDTGSLSDDIVRSILSTRDGEIWVGTDRGGLNRLDPATDIFRRYEHDPFDSASIGPGRVYSIFEDDEGTVWVGTEGGGLNRFNRTTESFDHITTEDGLPSNTVYGIIPDSLGRLWMSTNDGLSLFNPRNSAFANFGVQDGIQSREFNAGAFYRSDSGELLFGGVGGFNIIDPLRVRPSHIKPTVVLTSVQKDNQEVSLDRYVSGLESIELTHRDGVISFEFAAMDFWRPEERKYWYYLEGFSETWVELGERHDVTFTNLDPGEYVLRVTSAWSSGIPEDEDLALRINIPTPFWMTSWFYGLIIVVLGGALYSVYGVRMRQVKSQNVELERLVAERTRELAYRNDFEHLVSTISTRLMVLRPKVVDALITDALEEIATLVGAESAHLWQFSEEGKFYSMTHLWKTKGPEYELKDFQNVKASVMPWWTARVKDGEVVAVASVDALPEEASVEKAVLKEGGINSLIDVPIVFDDRVIGFLGLASVKDQRPWTEYEIALLQLTGQIFANAQKRSQAVAEIQSSRKHTAAILKNLIDAVITIGQDGLIESFSPAAEHIFGYGADEVIGQSMKMLMPGKVGRELENNLRRYLTTGEARMIGRTVELIGLHKDGSEFPVDMSTGVFEHEGKWVFTGILRDISVRKETENELRRLKDIAESAQHELEDQLRQAMRMEVIGQLAGGVAHDFNNILQVLQLNSEMLLDTLNKDSKQYEFARNLFEGSERAAALTRQLLVFSRRQVLESTDLVLEDVVADLLKMIGRTLGAHIDLKVQRSNDGAMVHADKGQIEQVVMNLCVNARDAMPDGGELIVETSRNTIDEEFCDRHSWAVPGEYATISVTDTGCGMDPVVRRRIFEPFFTTKEIGKGTGLGLATVFGIVTQHEGLIQVESEVGSGTTFQIYLPLLETGESQTPEQNEAAAPGGPEIILVAEDDDAVRRLMVRVLEGAGYQVLTAGDGEEAISVLKDRFREIDLILLDVVMPRKSGKDVYEYFVDLNPEGRVLFISGYSTGVLDSDFLENHQVSFVQKPVGARALLNKVREVLDLTP